jgi:hypothetical protein
MPAAPAAAATRRGPSTATTRAACALTAPTGSTCSAAATRCASPATGASSRPRPAALAAAARRAAPSAADASRASRIAGRSSRPWSRRCRRRPRPGTARPQRCRRRRSPAAAAAAAAARSEGPWPRASLGTEPGHQHCSSPVSSSRLPARTGCSALDVNFPPAAGTLPACEVVAGKRLWRPGICAPPPRHGAPYSCLRPRTNQTQSLLPMTAPPVRLAARRSFFSTPPSAWGCDGVSMGPTGPRHWPPVPGRTLPWPATARREVI